MHTPTRNQGFGIVPIVMVLAVVVVIGLIGFTLWNRTQTATLDNTADQQAVDAAPTIKNKEDLDAAMRSLDATDIAGTTTQDLDSESNF
jgi:hypothetical protein